jgi:hypothetical protein
MDGPYSMLVDLRDAMPPDADDAALLKASQRRQKRGNLQRMAIVVASPVLKGSARQVSFDAGMDEYTRVIDATRTPNWEELALGWVVSATEPGHAAESSEGAGKPAS